MPSAQMLPFLQDMICLLYTSEIELSEDLQHYKESLVLGLTAKQFLFSALALGVGTGIVLLLYEKIGITLSCYVDVYKRQVEGQRYLEECRKVLKEEQMDAVSMGLDFGPVSYTHLISVLKPCKNFNRKDRLKK